MSFGGVQARPYHRKHSDPNLGQKSNRLSMEEGSAAVGGLGGGRGSGCASGSSSSSSLTDRLLLAVPDPSAAGGRLPLLRSDSDIESAEVDPPDWRAQVSADRLATMKPREQKRQVNID